MGKIQHYKVGLELDKELQVSLSNNRHSMINKCPWAHQLAVGPTVKTTSSQSTACNMITLQILVTLLIMMSLSILLGGL